MTVEELIEKLNKYDKEMEVVFLNNKAELEEIYDVNVESGKVELS